MSVYSMDSIMRYINFYKIIKKETLNTHLQYLIQIDITNPEHIGGVLWTFTKKKKNPMLYDSLGLDDFIVDNDERIIDELRITYFLKM